MATVACHECDALQDEPRRVLRRADVRCWRCQAVLHRGTGRPIHHTFALIVAGAVLFVLGNAFPLVSLSAGGNEAATTLAGAILHLWQNQLELVAALVFLTTIAAPAFDIAAMLYLLLGVLRFDAGHAPTVAPGSALLLRMAHATKYWGMLEVFMLGALVSIVKLGSLAAVIVGVSLYSLGALILVLAAANASFDVRDVWARIPIRGGDDRDRRAGVGAGA